MLQSPRLSAAAILAVLLFASGAILARQADKPDSSPAPAKKSAEWKPDDFVFAEGVDDFRISHDGKSVVWVKSTGDKDKDVRVSNLFLTVFADKKEIQLTRGTDDVSNPRWSPSDDRIAFLSTRPLPKPDPNLASNQLWLLNTSGGEPWPVTRFVRGIKQFEWLDRDTLLFSAEEDPSLYETETKQRKDNSDVVDDSAHTPPVRLFKLSLKDNKVTRLTANSDWIEFFEVSHDSRKAIAVANRELSFDWDQKIPPVTYLVDLSSGKLTPILTDGKIWPESAAWTRDDSGVYFVAPFSSDTRFRTASVERAYFYDLVGGSLTEVNLDWDRGLANGRLSPVDDGFVALMADGVHDRPMRYTRHGSQWTRKTISAENAPNIFNLSLADDGRSLVYDYSTASKPSQLFHARLDGTKITSPAQFTNLNPGFASKPIAKSEIIHWKGANDDEVEGILFYPDQYDPSKSYPLIVATHGGPAWNDHDAWEESWAYPTNLYTERGAFVLKTNYHGSTGYGLKWVESICCGKYYDLEIPDIEKGVDSLIARGLVDSGKIGALGWSNGSILSIALTVADPDRYKAASVGAGDVEWISDWANVDFGLAFDNYYFGKSPLQDPQLYIEKSPFFKMDRVKTPTLIFFGTMDRNVPTEEGWSHYRALYSIGKVPVRFILFPGEPHAPVKLSHQLRKLNEESAWFDMYLFHANPPPNEALKTGSPLDYALRRRSIQKLGADFGVAFQPPAIPENPPPPTLIPETVPRAGIEIGRFEITRAQFASFDKSYSFDPGTENFPANGITFDQAQAYCKWLSDLTGETYRLPDEKEAAGLYKFRAGENTLDYWAGYSVNPDDAAKLSAELNLLGEGAPLLREVGSFPPDVDDPSDAAQPLVFDLDGNVAEWVVASDGSGKTMGGSADRPADPKSRLSPADLAYTGFRVVHIPPPPPPPPAK
ncbi:MAG TPA: prolyl oligopeptidase family serine peptidase [Verrucomicrobiae bacterium]|nr:prolyl oligopeptidase family serine peptidase [Verrucomicrobiae bacterium]